MASLLTLIAIVGGISLLFMVRTFIGALILGILDIITGIVVIGLPATGSLIIPQQIAVYAGAILLAKGVYCILITRKF